MVMAKILVADSDTSLLTTLALHLRNEEYEVVCAHDGLETFELARRERPDLLMLELQLSGEDGRSVHEFLAECPDLLAIPVLYLIAERNVPGSAAPKLPDTAMIRKPVATGEMLQKVSAALGGADSSSTAADGEHSEAA